MFVIGIVSPSSSVPPPGVPGFMSTKKLPSRKMRGRILSSASLWTGSADSFTSIVTSETVASSSAASIFVTLPTSTPAMRTGELSCRLLVVSNIAFSSKGWVNGFCFAKPK